MLKYMNVFSTQMHLRYLPKCISHTHALALCFNVIWAIKFHTSIFLNMLLFTLLRNSTSLGNTCILRFNSKYTSFLKPFLIPSLYTVNNHSVSFLPLLCMCKLFGISLFISSTKLLFLCQQGMSLYSYIFHLIQ